MTPGLIVPPVSPQELNEKRLAAERKAGMRCGGCDRRFIEGLEFVAFRVSDDGRDVKPGRAFACLNDDCEFSTLAAAEASAVRPVMWLGFPDEHRGELVPGAHNRAADSRLSAEERDAAGAQVATSHLMEATVTRLCSSCGQTFVHPLADVEKWTEREGLWCCPACSNDDRTESSG